MAIKTCGIEISGRAVRRKPWTALICVLVAAKHRSEAIQDPEAMDL